MIQHETTFYLHMALLEASKARGFCAPNPSVGAVIVKDGSLIATGYHTGVGTDHAEVHALKLAGSAAEGATMYVTLEPCSHHGHTPPCVDAILSAGIQRVVYAYHDPNPEVSGRGADLLNKHGVQCEQWSVPEVSEYYVSYQHWVLHHKPFITAKIAVSANGKIANPDGSAVAITGEACQRLTHGYRLRSDVILTTQRTIALDNPYLNVRFREAKLSKPVRVLDSLCQFSLNTHLAESCDDIRIYCSESAPHISRERFEREGISCVAFPTDKGRLSLEAVIRHMGREGIHDVWVEAGGVLLQSLLNERLLDRLVLYRSSKTLAHDAVMGLTQKQLDAFCQRDSMRVGEDDVFIIDSPSRHC